MYYLIEYNDNYSETSGILWQYHRGKPTKNVGNSTIIDFNEENATTDSFTIKEKIAVETGGYGTKKVEIMVPLKYLSNFWRTLEMPLINCEIDLYLNWSEMCVILATVVVNQGATF